MAVDSPEMTGQDRSLGEGLNKVGLGFYVLICLST
jgi:hypothetical protein